MDENVIATLSRLDREDLMERMSSGLSALSGALEMTPMAVAYRIGLDKDRFSMIASGKRKMKWSEYMSILFFLWDDERGRIAVEEKGLFPEELKRVLKVNRNTHARFNRWQN